MSNQEIKISQGKNKEIVISGLNPDDLRSLLTSASLHYSECKDVENINVLFAENEYDTNHAKESVKWYDHMWDLCNKVEGAFAQCYYTSGNNNPFPDFSDNVKDKQRELRFARARAELAAREYVKAIEEEYDDPDDPSPFALIAKAQGFIQNSVRQISYVGKNLWQHSKPYSNDCVNYSMKQPREYLRQAISYLQETEKTLTEYDEIPKEQKNWDYAMKTTLPWE